MPRSRLLLWAVLLSLRSVVAVAAEDLNPYLAKAKVFYEGLEYEKCVQRLEQAARWPGVTTAQSAEIELFSGICKFNLAQPDEDVREHFRLALTINPRLALPSLVSPRLEQLFKEEASKVAVARPNAPDSPTVPPSVRPPEVNAPASSRVNWPAYTLMGVGAAGVVVGITMGVLANDSAGRYRASTDPEQKPRLRDEARGRATAADVAYVVGGLALAAGLAWRLWPEAAADAPQARLGVAPGAVTLSGSF